MKPGQYPVWKTRKPRKGEFKELKSKTFPGEACPRIPFEALLLGLGNQSVYILDPRLLCTAYVFSDYHSYVLKNLSEQGKPNSELKFILGPSWYFHLIWAACTNSKNYINSFTTKGLPVYKEQQRRRRKSNTNHLRTTSWLMSKMMTAKFKAIRTYLESFWSLKFVYFSLPT